MIIIIVIVMMILRFQNVEYFADSVDNIIKLIPFHSF